MQEPWPKMRMEGGVAEGNINSVLGLPDTRCSRTRAPNHPNSPSSGHKKLNIHVWPAEKKKLARYRSRSCDCSEEACRGATATSEASGTGRQQPEGLPGPASGAQPPHRGLHPSPDAGKVRAAKATGLPEREPTASTVPAHHGGCACAVPEAEVPQRSPSVYKMAALSALLSGCGRLFRGLLAGPAATSWARPPDRGFREGESRFPATSQS